MSEWADAKTGKCHEEGCGWITDAEKTYKAKKSGYERHAWERQESSMQIVAQHQENKSQRSVKGIAFNPTASQF